MVELAKIELLETFHELIPQITQIASGILCNLWLKGGAADALQIRAVGVQLAGSRCKVVRKENEAFSVQRAGNVDLFDRRIGRYPVRTDACPNTSLRVVCRCRCDFNLLLKHSGVRRVSHRTGHIEYPHLQPTPPILKATRVGILIVREYSRRNN